MTPPPADQPAAGADGNRPAGHGTGGRKAAVRSTSVSRSRREDQRTILRFDRVERCAHQLNGTLFLILMVTGLALYFEPVMALVGRRKLVQDIHVYSGLALPVPLVISALGYWGKELRADISRLNRWLPDDGTWLRVSLSDSVRRRSVRAQLRLGKFNAGQKLNAAFTLGAILVMLATGSILRWYHPWPLAWRTGATFVHDWLSVAIVVVVIGHIRFALHDREALRSIWTGTISRGWAKIHAPAWLDEVDEEVRPEAVAAPEVEAAEK
jgi:formate dehydrogenase gamma subunit